MNAIELERVSKRYGSRRGIDDVSLSVPAGTVFGFIGPNGAGKSTTIRVLLGLLRADAGRAQILGRDAFTDGPTARLAIGYVAGESHFYDDIRVGDLLEYLGGFHPGDHRTRRGELIEAFAIEPGARATELSQGNRRKVAIAAALQHRPKLVILDEPTNGLDPVMQARLFEILAKEARDGNTVIFSSHVLSEVQAVCERVGVMREGRLVAVDDVAALRARQLRRVIVTGEARGVTELAGVSQVEREGDGIRFLYGGPMPELLRALAAAAPTDVRIEEPNLEEIFLAHYTS
jgi:ABC-2 type transport system ATP-binding protein